LYYQLLYLSHAVKNFFYRFITSFFLLFFWDFLRCGGKEEKPLQGGGKIAYQFTATADAQAHQ